MSSKLQPHEDLVKSIGTLERSVSRNPALLTAWSELERLYRARDDRSKAQVAARHRETLERLPPALFQPAGLFSSAELPAEQVRQPMNRRGLTDWRHFEPWLAPLQEALA